MSKHLNEVHGKPQEAGPAPDQISADQPGAFCEISILSDHNYSWDTKTGIQLKNSVSFQFIVSRTEIYLIFPDQRYIPRLSGPEPAV